MVLWAPCVIYRAKRVANVFFKTITITTSGFTWVWFWKIYFLDLTQLKNSFLKKIIIVILFLAVQHERAPRNYSKKPSYFPDLSAVAIGAAAAAASANSTPFGSTGM